MGWGICSMLYGGNLSHLVYVQGWAVNKWMKRACLVVGK